MRREPQAAIGPYILLGVAAILILPPVVWALLTSFKVEQHILVYPPQWLPLPPTLEHYRALFQGMAPRLLLNNVIVGVGTILLALVLAFRQPTRRPDFRSGGGSRSCWPCSASP